MNRSRLMVIGVAAVAIGVLGVSTAIGGPSLKSLVKKQVKKEVAKQLAGKTGPQGLPGQQGIQGPQGGTGATGAPGADDTDGGRVATRITQTVEGLQSGDGMANKTEMQLSGDTWVKRPNEFLQFFPVGPGVNPPDTCTNPDGALHLELRAAVPDFTLHTWVIDWVSGDLQPTTLEDFTFDFPPGGPVDINVFAWDTCEGEGERWGIGGFGFVFRTTILGTV